MSQLEKMGDFFDKRADTYDSHMLDDMKLEEFYQEITKQFEAAADPFSLLDLGCGTGLELEWLLKAHPRMAVTGIDLSAEMLSLLRRKLPNANLRLLCGSYFEVDLGEIAFDHALSTFSLHHFGEAQKLALYQKVHRALKEGGAFILGDYTVNTMELQAYYMAEGRRLRAQAGDSNGMYHYDTPLTAQTETRLLRSAGFSSVTIPKQWDSATIFVARK
jgi:tRNA (cmo5U34)-methyltransferase